MRDAAAAALKAAKKAEKIQMKQDLANIQKELHDTKDFLESANYGLSDYRKKFEPARGELKEARCELKEARFTVGNLESRLSAAEELLKIANGQVEELKRDLAIAKGEESGTTEAKATAEAFSELAG